MEQSGPPPPPPLPPTLPPARVDPAPPMPPTLPPTDVTPALERAEMELEVNEVASTVVPPLHRKKPTPRTKTKFTFSVENKLLLAQSVATHSAHLAEHGHLDEEFEKVRLTFLENLPKSTWETVSVPGVKTLRDKFRAMIRARRIADRSNASASGISEEITETDQVLDDLIKEKDDYEEEKKEAKDEATAKEADLVGKGFELRGSASCRTKKESEEEKANRKKERGQNRKRRRDEFETDDDYNKLARQNLEDKRVQNKLNHELRLQELALQREKFEEDRLDRQAAREQNARQVEQNEKQWELVTLLLNKLK